MKSFGYLQGLPFFSLNHPIIIYLSLTAQSGLYFQSLSFAYMSTVFNGCLVFGKRKVLDGRDLLTFGICSLAVSPQRFPDHYNPKRLSEIPSYALLICTTFTSLLLSMAPFNLSISPSITLLLIQNNQSLQCSKGSRAIIS